MSGEFHEVALVWPEMSEAELQALTDDIAAHGQHTAIWRHQDGRIIDGRHRWLACQRLGIDCPSNTYRGEDGAELVAFVVSLNDKRRHLSTAKRAWVAANLANLNHGQRADRVERSDDRSNAVTQAQAAKMMGVGEATVRRALAVKNSGDEELIAAVEGGETTVNAAAQKVYAAKREQKPLTKPKPKSKPRLQVVPDEMPSHLAQMINIVRTLSAVMAQFADVNEAASLCDRYKCRLEIDDLYQASEFLYHLAEMQDAGSAAKRVMGGADTSTRQHTRGL